MFIKTAHENTKRCPFVIIYIKRNRMPGTSNSGRRSSHNEKELKRKLSLLEEEAFHALEQGLNKGYFKYVQLWFSYMYGKPRDPKEFEINPHNIELPIIKFVKTNDEEIK